MRQFISGDGLDVTTAAFTFMHGRTELLFADLYLIGEYGDPQADWLTNWESALTWPVWGKFCPTVVERGRVTSEVGLKVAALEMTWHPKLTAFGYTAATANVYQRAQNGFYDNRTFRLWRTVMPARGDANTYGACELFGGRIGQTEVSRLQIKFTINSFLDVVNQQVPPNVIESSNPVSSFVGNTPVLADAETAIAQFTVVSPSSTTVITGQCTGPTPNKIYAGDRFKNGFIVFNPGSTLAGYWSPVGTNADAIVGGTHYNQFQVFDAFPWAPIVGDTFYVSTQWPVDMASATGNQYRGFPYVPDPSSAV